MSELFWEGLEQIIDSFAHLFNGTIEQGFLNGYASRYADEVHGKTEGLENCIGFIDGTFLKISRPKNSLQNVVYKGHKRAHSLKLQAVTNPDGIFLHVFGTLEGRRHDWKLYVRSELDDQFTEFMEVDGLQYCTYGDSGYNWREFLEIPFQGSNISDNQNAFNKRMSEERVTVEWMFKEVKQYWTAVDFKRKMKLGEAQIGAMYMAALLLTNV